MRTRGKPLAGWTVETDRADVDVNRPAGRWIPITVRFNSEDCTQVNLYIGAYGTPSGKCWIDNVRSETLPIRNGSFEELTPDGKAFPSWSADRPGTWTHTDTERTSSGKRSLLLFDPSYAAQMIRLMQTVAVTPNTDYAYTFDFYMEDDFYGAIRCGAITVPPTPYRALRAEYFNIDDLIADRAAAGFQQCLLSLEGGSAYLAQKANVSIDANLEAGVSVKTRKGFKGAVTLSVSDANLGRDARGKRRSPTPAINGKT